MSKRPGIDLFCEDRAHEELLTPLLERCCAEEGLSHATVKTRSAIGGHGRALEELQKYQVILRHQGASVPDLLVVAIDANCTPYSEMTGQIKRKINPELFPHTALACPDPHIERWYLADSAAFEAAVGARPLDVQPGCGKEDRYELKRALAESVRRAGHPPLLGGIEFARDLAAEIDPFRAGKADAAFKHFFDAVRAALRQLSRR
ncbi:MAG: hypothetical protein ACLF0G_00180 [Candidatus Brocadiia bacterium]